MTPFEIMANALGVNPEGIQKLEGYEAMESVLDQGLDLIEGELRSLYSYLSDGALSKSDTVDIASVVYGISERLPALRAFAQGVGSGNLMGKGGAS